MIELWLKWAGCILRRASIFLSWNILFYMVFYCLNSPGARRSRRLPCCYRGSLTLAFSSSLGGPLEVLVGHGQCQEGDPHHVCLRQIVAREITQTYFDHWPIKHHMTMDLVIHVDAQMPQVPCLEDYWDHARGWSSWGPYGPPWYQTPLPRIGWWHRFLHTMHPPGPTPSVPTRWALTCARSRSWGSQSGISVSCESQRQPKTEENWVTFQAGDSMVLRCQLCIFILDQLSFPQY